jgi:hypothetical protein
VNRTLNKQIRIEVKTKTNLALPLICLNEQRLLMIQRQECLHIGCTPTVLKRR